VVISSKDYFRFVRSSCPPSAYVYDLFLILSRPFPPGCRRSFCAWQRCFPGLGRNSLWRNADHTLRCAVYTRADCTLWLEPTQRAYCCARTPKPETIELGFRYSSGVGSARLQSRRQACERYRRATRGDHNASRNDPKAIPCPRWFHWLLLVAV